MKTSYFDILHNILQRFEPISLGEMDGVKLLDRTDVKFALSFKQLSPVLEALQQHYRVLTIKNNRIFSYRTEYFDTPGMSMFFEHHNGKLNRFKIRHREYVESNLNFLEVKFKSNKGRVTKQRIQGKADNQPAFHGFVNEYTPYDPKSLNKTVVNHFNRFTMVDNMLKERVTVDFNLAFHNSMMQLWLKGLVIIEIKQNRKDRNSPVFDVLKANGIRPASVSKYCLGVSLLSKNSKFNNFKKTLLMINKLSHVELSA